MKKLRIFLALALALAGAGCGRGSEDRVVEQVNIKETYSPVTNRIKPLLTGKLEVPVAKLTDSEDPHVLVSNGIPFAPGQLFSEKNFAVIDGADKEISIAVKVLARWPFDNSIRALLVQFPYIVEKRYAPVTLRLGIPRTAPDSPITEVNWVLPEGYIVLPARWLCVSEAAGEQIPMQINRFSGGPMTKYEENIQNNYPAMRDKPWSDDVADDGYYDITHVFYQLYVRAGNEDYFKSARREAVHYREGIVRIGPDRGSHKQHKQTRYVYVEGMIDDYLLTGDTKSLVTAGYMAEYLKKSYDPDKAFFPKSATRFWTEREAAFPFLGIISYYELTGDKNYLIAAKNIMRNLYRTQNEWPDRGGFIHNLYSHDPEEGARRNEYGGSPFMTGLLLEAVVKYHQVTNSNIAKDSIFKALDWLMNQALAPDGNSFVYTTAVQNKNEGHPDLNLLIAHAFGYGYKISGYTKKEYLDFGSKIFNYGANNAFLGNRKHFNQNYRSSGHFLAYIEKDGK